MLVVTVNPFSMRLTSSYGEQVRQTWREVMMSLACTLYAAEALAAAIVHYRELRWSGDRVAASQLCYRGRKLRVCDGDGVRNVVHCRAPDVQLQGAALQHPLQLRELQLFHQATPLSVQAEPLWKGLEESHGMNLPPSFEGWH